MKRFPRKWGVAAALVFYALLAVLAAWGLMIKRHYHSDETWSLNAISHSYTGLFQYILTEDNHPPFYYLLAKFWASFAGDSVEAVRVMSYLFSLLSLSVIGWLALRHRSFGGYAAILLLATNPLFIYYSATVRPYAMVVALTSLITAMALLLRQHNMPPDDDRDAGGHEIGSVIIYKFIFYASCLILGITHYYGTLFCFVVLIFDFLERRISVSALPGLLCISLLLIWPCLQIYYGTLDRQIVANSWVYVSPFISTFNNMLMGIFPAQLISTKPPYLFSLGLLLLLFGSLYSKNSLSGIVAFFKPRKLFLCPSLYLLAIILIVYVVSALIDLKTPFSTPYYFLTCLPAAAILFQSFCRRLSRFWGPYATPMLVTVVVVVQLILSSQRLSVV
jgi:uncharacterized membrane protein